MDLQSLLWEKQYVCLAEKLLVESKFVMEKMDGEPIEMVRVGVSESGIIIARYTADNFNYTSDSDFDYIELLHWFPNKYVKLSPSTKTHFDSTFYGKVLKLKLKNGKSWLLELAERSDTESIWQEWLSIIQDIKTNRRNTKKQNTVVSPDDRFETDMGGIMTKRDSTQGLNIGYQKLDINLTEDQSSSLTHQEQEAKNTIHGTESRNTSLENSNHISRTTAEPTWNKLWMSTSTTRLESSHNQPLSRDRNEVLFSVGNLFGLFNVLTMRHGHAQALPMASTTALHMLEEMEGYLTFEEKRCVIPKSISLPDRLDGEAGFLEDSLYAAKKVHRQGLAYADLLSEDDNTRAFLVNGHVMLLDDKQIDLYNQIERKRNEFNDVIYTIRQNKQMKQKLITNERNLNVASSINISGINDNRMEYETSRKKEQTTRKPNKLHKLLAGTRRMSIIGSSKHQNDDDASSSQSNELESIGYVDPADIAKELTLIDMEMLLRLHESELANCAWQKNEKEVHAKHVLAILDIAMRIVGLLASEIIKETCINSRTERVANIIDIACECQLLNNYHSLRTCLAALQIIPIYRLYGTWRNLEEEYPEKFRKFSELEEFSTDADGYTSFRQAMRIANTSHCIPFIGTILQDVIASEFEFDETLIDAHVKRLNSSAVSPYKEPVMLVTEEQADNSRSSTNLAEDAMHSFASAWRALRLPITRSGTHSVEDTDVRECHSREEVCSSVSPERRKHIQKLILEYAQRLGSEYKAQNKIARAGSWMDEELLDWGNLFNFIKTQKHKVTETKLSSPCESSIRIGSEDVTRDQVNRTLFLFQCAAVQYDMDANPMIRKFLLTKPYISGDELYRQSRVLDDT
ncbi:uncharacterized protein [Antedon mediterranea]|uniref:uncharacterized protein n=1 Tax=Antedon mediterranea TaxID=105859 RepID=UPI003AF48FE6